MNRHYDLIQKFYANEDTYTALALIEGTWRRVAHPVWHDHVEYKAIPTKHLDVALPYLNDDAIVEMRASGRGWVGADAYSACTVGLAFLSNYEYRVKLSTRNLAIGYYLCEADESDGAITYACYWGGLEWSYDTECFNADEMIPIKRLIVQDL